MVVGDMIERTRRWTMRLRVRMCRRFGHRWGPWERIGEMPLTGLTLWRRTCQRCGESETDWGRAVGLEPIAEQAERFIHCALGGGA